MPKQPIMPSNSFKWIIAAIRLGLALEVAEILLGLEESAAFPDEVIVP